MNDLEQVQSDEENIRLGIESYLADTWTSIPCIVQSFNASQNTIEARPAIKVKVSTEDGEEVETELPLLVDVPVCLLRGGGYCITVPIKAGDNVLVVFADRCIDAWWQNGGVQNQEQLRIHDLSDGFAVLNPSNLTSKVSGYSTSSIQIRSDDGSTSIDLKNGVVTIKSSSVTIDGNLTVNGNITSSGALSGSTATIGGKSFASHIHGTPSGDSTGVK
jgi:hypothetical protein